MLLIQPIPKTGSYGGGTCSFPKKSDNVCNVYQCFNFCYF